MRTALSILVAALFLTAAPSPASAQRLRAQVYIVQQRIPRGLSSRQLLRWARGHQTTRLQETDEPDMADRKFRAELVVNFNRAPDDNEFHVLFYDTQEADRFVNDMAVYINDRTQRTFVQRINLSRPTFQPQRRMELVVTVRREEAGRKSFQVLGEERRNTGVVGFTEEEVRTGRSSEDQGEDEEDEPPPQSQEPAPPDEPARMDDDPPPARRSEADRSGGLCAVDPGSRSGAGALVLAVALLALGRRRRRT